MQCRSEVVVSRAARECMLEQEWRILLRLTTTGVTTDVCRDSLRGGRSTLARILAEGQIEADMKVTYFWHCSPCWPTISDKSLMVTAMLFWERV
jgi:hypothetical protein